MKCQVLFSLEKKKLSAAVVIRVLRLEMVIDIYLLVFFTSV